ncbi:hypothetical protein F7P69_04235 [Cellulosimicrobium funkei]|nr:hypothetical protein [Cellulosimicrobium funkei]
MLSDEAAGLLLHLAATGEAPTSGSEQESGPWAELITAGLTDPGTGLSAQGATVTGPLREPAGRAILTAHRGGMETSPVRPARPGWGRDRLPGTTPGRLSGKPVPHLYPGAQDDVP